MDSFLQKFSLQNLLRQFFCGVVFFVPLYLFAREKMPATDLLKWESGVFFLFSSVALAVGTIIYHLEKNLYSYPLMYMYERFIFHNKKEDSSREASPFNWWLIWCIAGVACLLVLGCRHFLVSCPWLVLMTLAFFWLLIVTRMLLESSDSMIAGPTLQQWRIEYEASQKRRENKLLDELENKSVQYAAAEKIATWSDFIHCVQSCCFAWIFGSLLAYYLTETVVEGFYQGLTAAFVLLAAEMIIDMHRYRFAITVFSQTDIGFLLMWEIYSEYVHSDSAKIIANERPERSNCEKEDAMSPEQQGNRVHVSESKEKNNSTCLCPKFDVTSITDLMILLTSVIKFIRAIRKK